MCEVSDKLKLCTCSKVDFDRVKHYWILHRFIEGKENIVIGLPNLPNFIDEEIDLKNRKLLLSLLNQPGIFDKDISPREKDLLELSFKLTGKQDRITYGFKYKKGKWREEYFDYLVWMWHHQDESKGKIENAFKSSQKINRKS